MSIFRDFVERYIQLINTLEFTKYEKEFADRIQSGISKIYQRREENVVEYIEGIINEVGDFDDSFKRFRILTRSVFIHGNRSKVEFDYYGQRVQTELGDLIFILSVVFKGQKYLERYTISQFKKDKKRNSRQWWWDLSNRKQLYLLSRFPKFCGVSGIIPRREFNLLNRTGGLGSYNFLFSPGDFAFISAERLETLIGKRKSISMNKLFSLIDSINYPPCMYHVLCQRVASQTILPICFILYRALVFCVLHTASNIHDFIHKFLIGCIGEPIYTNRKVVNGSAFIFLHKIMSLLRIRARRERRADIENLVKDFFNFPYSTNPDFREENIDSTEDEGGIGIIFTLIDLGE